MRCRRLLDLAVQIRNPPNQTSDYLRTHLHHCALRLNHRPIPNRWYRLPNSDQTSLDQFGIATALLVEERTQPLRRNLLQFLQRRPTLQQRAHQLRVQLFKPFQHLREINLQLMGQPIDLRCFFVHQIAPLLNQILYPTRGFAIGRQTTQLIAMLQQQLQQQVRILRVILGPRRIQRFPHFGRHHRWNRKQMQATILTEHEHQGSLHLFHCHRDRAIVESSTELPHPGFNRFWRVLHFALLSLRSTCSLQAPRMLLVRTISPLHRRELEFLPQHFSFCHCSHFPSLLLASCRPALLPRNPYRESCLRLRQTLSEYSFWKQSASHGSRLCSKTSCVWRSH